MVLINSGGSSSCDLGEALLSGDNDNDEAIREACRNETATSLTTSSSDSDDDDDWSNGLWQAIERQRHLNPLDDDESWTSGRKKWLAIGFAQLIVLLAVSGDASSYTLSNVYKVDTPMFQMFWMYLLLSLHLVFRNDDEQCNCRVPGTKIHLRIPWWVYLGYAILDVFPNLLFLQSQRFTSLTSSTLLGNLTVPSTMLFCKLLLGKNFSGHHYVGAALCVLGGMATVLTDDIDATGDSSSYHAGHHCFGDLLAIGAALCFGLGDTICEFSVKHIDRKEYLGMIGLFGTILTACTSAVSEREELQTILYLPLERRIEVAWIMVWYVASHLAYYLSGTSFLVISDATLLNLSLQTENMWTVAFSVIAYHFIPPVGFFVSAVLVATGVFVYELGWCQGGDDVQLMGCCASQQIDDEEMAQLRLIESGESDFVGGVWEGLNTDADEVKHLASCRRRTTRLRMTVCKHT